MRALAIVVLLAASVAHAEDKAAAERYFRAGAKAYAAQNFAAAATDFDEAYKNLAMPEIAFSGAQAYRRLYRVASSGGGPMLQPLFALPSSLLFGALMDLRLADVTGDAIEDLLVLAYDPDGVRRLHVFPQLSLREVGK